MFGFAEMPSRYDVARIQAWSDYLWPNGNDCSQIKCFAHLCCCKVHGTASVFVSKVRLHHTISELRICGKIEPLRSKTTATIQLNLPLNQRSRWVTWETGHRLWTLHSRAAENRKRKQEVFEFISSGWVRNGKTMKRWPYVPSLTDLHSTEGLRHGPALAAQHRHHGKVAAVDRVLKRCPTPSAARNKSETSQVTMKRTVIRYT